MTKKVAMADIVEHQRGIPTYEMAEYTSGAKFRNGDTLFARITPCLENGKIAQVDILDDSEVGFGSTEFIVWREKKGLSHNNFLFYLANYPPIKDTAIKSMIGTSGRQRVQIDVLKEYDFLAPPLPTQEVIAATLSCLDAKIEVNNKINENLERQAQAIFKSWFVDFEPFQDGEFVESELGLIPKGWRVATLDEIARYVNGLAMQRYRPEENERSLPVMKIRELRQQSTDRNSERCSGSIASYYVVNDGDVVFSWSGSLLVDIWTGGKAGLNQHLFKVTSETFPKWFFYLWTKFHLEQFQSIAAARATTMGHIKRSHLNEAKVLIPSSQQMKDMTSVMSKLIDMKISLRIENSTLASLRDALLPKLMSGEIEVPIEDQ